MPFDGQVTLTRLQKLERLRELLENARDGEQYDCGRCLMARMVADPVMQAAGFNVTPIPSYPSDGWCEGWAKTETLRRQIWGQQMDAADAFFGGDHLPVFGTQTIARKRKDLDEIIVHERGE